MSFLLPLHTGLGAPSSPSCKEKEVMVSVAALTHPPYMHLFFLCLIFCRNCFSVLLLPIILFPLRWLYLFSQKQCFGWGSSPHRCCPHCIMDFPITLSTMSETKHVDVHDAVGQYSKHRSPFRALCQHIPRTLFHRTRRIVTCNCFDLVKKIC